MILSIRNLIFIPFLFIIVFMTFSALFVSMEVIYNHFDKVLFQHAQTSLYKVEAIIEKIATQDQMGWIGQNNKMSIFNPNIRNEIHFRLMTQSKPPYLVSIAETSGKQVNVPFSFNKLRQKVGMPEISIYIKNKQQLFKVYESKALINKPLFDGTIKTLNTNSKKNKIVSKIHLDGMAYNTYLLQHPTLKNMYIATIVPSAAIYNNRNTILSLVVFSLVMINLIIAIIYFFILKRITMSLSQMTNMAKRISRGQSTMPVKVKSNNEIGILAQSFNHMLNNVQTKTAELIYERNRSKMILAQLPDGIIVTDLEHKLLSANRVAETMLGFSTDRAKGQEIIKYLRDENLSSFFSNEVKKIQDKPVIRELEIKNSNGKIECFQITVTGLLDSTYQKSGMITVIRNITIEKKAKGLRDDFLRSVSHELKTPLTSITGFLDILSKEAYGSLNSKQKEFVNISVHNAKYLKKLINDFIYLSKLNSGQIVLTQSTISLNKIIESITDKYSIFMDKKSNKLSVEFQNDNMSIYADKDKLYQIIENLVINANKFTDKGMIKCVVNQTDLFTTIMIKDSGFGMNKEQVYRLNDAFEKTGQGKPFLYNGLDIELAMVKELVKMHNGKVFVESELNQGACFTVMIPVETSPLKQESKETKLTSHSG